MDRLSVVLSGSARRQRTSGSSGLGGGPPLQPARLCGRAAALDALLPDLQAEDAARLERSRARWPLPALPLVGVAAVLAVLPLVRAPRGEGRTPQRQPLERALATLRAPR